MYSFMYSFRFNIYVSLTQVAHLKINISVYKLYPNLLIFKYTTLVKLTDILKRREYYYPNTLIVRRTALVKLTDILKRREYY